MKIAWFANYLNHHTCFVMDELYEICNGQFWHISTKELPESFLKTGYPLISRSYLIKAYEKNGYDIAIELAKTVDVAVFAGSEEIQPFRHERLKRNLFSFECGERWLKRGLFNLLSPRLLLSQLRYHLYYHNTPYYNLCESAFAPADYKLMHSFKNKSYKWGYFTNLKPFDITNKVYKANRFIWVNRFIDWKHPELPIMMAAKLRNLNKEFVLDMYGSGVLLNKMQNLINRNHLEDCVHLCGNLPNEAIVDKMKEYDFLLSTSDQNEGWGATVNEGMSSGCVVIGSHLVGSVPFLIKDGYNGLIFKFGNVDYLVKKTLCILDQPEKCKNLALNAYFTMHNVWSPRNAAISLIKLITDLQAGQKCSIEEGPCSVAHILSNNYFN